MELNRLARASALALAFALAIVPADAQRYQDSTGTIVPGVVPIAPGIGPLFTTANPGKIAGTFTATILGFAPTPGAGGLAQILFSDASSHNVALPSGSDFKVENTSANPAYCVASASGSTAATAVNEYVPASSTRAFHGVSGGTTFTNIACISPLSTLSITIVGGTGLAMDSGGGGGSGSSGGAVTQAAGSVAAGAYSAGAFVSGSFLAGALADGSIVALGTTADTAWTSGGGTVISILKAIAGNQPTDAAQASTTSGQTGTLAMGAAQTTPPPLTSGLSYPFSIDPVSGGLRVLCVGSSCSGSGGGSSSGGSTPQTTAGAQINVSTAVTTQLVSASGSNLIYVTAYKLVAAGTTSVSFEYGTGSLCGSGTTVIDGPMSLTAQAGAAQGSGLGVVLPPIPAGNALCMVNSAAVQVGGSLTYTQTNATLTAFGGGGGATPYAQSNVYTPISAATSSAPTTISAGSPSTVVAVNVGSTNGAYCAPGATATTSDHYLAPGGGWASWAPNTATQLACITASGTTTVNVTGGSGTFAGSGGGGGGGGGGTASASGQCGSTSLVPCITTPANTTATQSSQSGAWSVTVLGQINTQASIPIDTAAATTTQIVAAVTGKSIYITHFDFMANGATNFRLVSGTGSNCVAGQAEVTGPYGLAAQSGAASGSGQGAIAALPASAALCTVNSAAIQVSGLLSYAQQ